MRRWVRRILIKLRGRPFWRLPGTRARGKMDPSVQRLLDERRATLESRRLTEAEIIDGFAWILGRVPESERAIDAHLSLGSVAELRRVLLASAEFDEKYLGVRSPASKWILAPVYDGRYHMWLDLRDRFVSCRCLADDYEPIETAFIRHNARAGGTFLDIGANIGWHTLGLAEIAGEAGKVHAFEPRRPTVDHLRNTIDCNGLGGTVGVFDCGLWNETSTLKLVFDPNSQNPGGSFVTREPGVSDTQDIQLRKLTDMVSGPVDFIKIDVEGAEPKVLEGAEALIGDFKPLILAEIHPGQMGRVSGTSPRDFIAWMARFGYECRMLEAGYEGLGIADFPERIGRDVTNVVFCHKGHDVRF